MYSNLFCLACQLRDMSCEICVRGPQAPGSYSWPSQRYAMHWSYCACRAWTIIMLDLPELGSPFAPDELPQRQLWGWICVRFRKRGAGLSDCWAAASTVIAVKWLLCCMHLDARGAGRMLTQHVTPVFSTLCNTLPQGFHDALPVGKSFKYDLYSFCAYR